MILELDEAIKRFINNAEYERTHGNLQGCIEFRQLAEWLKELKQLREQTRWIPVSDRLPSKEERKEWIDKNLDGLGYLYPCLVTRYSSVNPDRTKNNPYVAKHYYDGEDFVNNGEEVCSEYVIAWMPLPEPYVPDTHVGEMSESEEGE